MQDARLSESTEGNPGFSGYSTEDFVRWARKVDIYTLGDGAADFALEEHEEIIKSFGNFRHSVSNKLSKAFTYENTLLPGQLKDIGSCWDGSKVGSVNEMDSLYIIEGVNITIRPSHKHGIYHVYLGKGPILCEIEPRKLRDVFADKYSELVSQVELPSCLKHGGYNSQGSGLPNNGYSGVRFNGPAATSQFLTKNKTLLTWDMTPVVVLTDAEEIQEGVWQSMQPIITDNPDKMFSPSDVHLIPDAIDNIWRISTAQMEAELLRVLSREAPMKTALSFCKVLSSLLKKWSQLYKVDLISGVNVVKELDEYLGILGMSGKTQVMDILNRKMRFAHIWIPSTMRDKYHEDSKSSISINNAAVKHILMKAAYKLKGAFAPKANTELVTKLIRIVFETLGNDDVYSSEHALLEGIRISHFSVSPSMASEKQAMARDVCRQCRTLLRETMTEVIHSVIVMKCL